MYTYLNDNISFDTFEEAFQYCKEHVFNLEFFEAIDNFPSSAIRNAIERGDPELYQAILDNAAQAKMDYDVRYEVDGWWIEGDDDD